MGASSVCICVSVCLCVSVYAPLCVSSLCITFLCPFLCARSSYPIYQHLCAEGGRDAKQNGNSSNKTMIKSAAVSDAPIACPACGTAWDYKQQPCRICAKDIDWAKYQKESHKKAHRMRIFFGTERAAGKGAKRCKGCRGRTPAAACHGSTKKASRA